MVATYNMQNRVVRSDNLEPLIFAPRIRDPFNNGFASCFEVIAFTLRGFAGATLTDVDFRTDGLGDKRPRSESRSVDGDLLTFRYDDPLINDAFDPPGVQDTSFFPAINTTATRFSLTGSMTIYGRDARADPDGPLTSKTIRGIAVPAVVPLPASAVLLLAGIAGLGFAGCRMRR